MIGQVADIPYCKICRRIVGRRGFMFTQFYLYNLFSEEYEL